MTPPCETPPAPALGEIAELRHLDTYLRLHHGLTIADVTPTETPGYWRITKPCGGAGGGCRHPLHSTLFNEGECQHTVSYFDPRRQQGRFSSPYTSWHLARLRTALSDHQEPANGRR